MNKIIDMKKVEDIFDEYGAEGVFAHIRSKLAGSFDVAVTESQKADRAGGSVYYAYVNGVKGLVTTDSVYATVTVGGYGETREEALKHACRALLSPKDSLGNVQHYDGVRQFLVAQNDGREVKTEIVSASSRSWAPAPKNPALSLT